MRESTSVIKDGGKGPQHTFLPYGKRKLCDEGDFALADIKSEIKKETKENILDLHR